MSTRDGHVSRVLDHAHWIPGEILPHFYVRHVLVAHLEPKLEICKNLEQVYCTVLYCKTGFAVRKKVRPLLYTNMTLTKTNLALKPLT